MWSFIDSFVEQTKRIARSSISFEPPPKTELTLDELKTSRFVGIVGECKSEIKKFIRAILSILQFDAVLFRAALSRAHQLNNIVTEFHVEQDDYVKRLDKSFMTCYSFFQSIYVLSLSPICNPRVFW